MIQQVDLYKAEFKPRKILLSLNQIIVCWLLVVGCCSASSWYFESRLETQREKIAQERAAEASLRQKVQQLETDLAERTEDTSLQQDNERLKRALSRGAELLKIVSEQQGDDDLSVAGVMQGLALQTMEGVALSEIHISEGPALIIQGKTRLAESVPRYLKQLGEHDVFKGLKFADMQLDAQEGPMDFKIASVRTSEAL